ncbi:MAG: replication restart helicase PriA [Syntrophales bacterium]
MFVRVVIPIPSPKTFIYAVPSESAAFVAIGKRVVVPFGAKRLTGWIVELSAETSEIQNVKDIIAIPDAEPLFSGDDLAFFEWIASYYLHPLGMVLAEALPGGINTTASQNWIRLVPGTEKSEKNLTKGQKSLLELLSYTPKGISLRNLCRKVGKKDIHREVSILEGAGLIISEEIAGHPAIIPKQEKWVEITQKSLTNLKLTEKQTALLKLLSEKEGMPVSALEERMRSLSFLDSLAAKGAIRLYEKEVFREYLHAEELPEDNSKIILNSDQSAALAEINKGLNSRQFSPYLLHGVTGSGKTEIYLRAMEEVLQSKGSALYLVPEIALTAQLIRRVKSRFPEEKIAVLHSGIPNNTRYDQWRKIKSGEIRLIVGARSAIFAPARNLRLIVVDEEHDPSYKQDDRLHYNGRDLALYRGKKTGAVVLLGSATPGIQTYFYAQAGIYRYLSLPKRVNSRPLPLVEIVDMRNERDSGGRMPIFSRRMILALGETLSAKKQALIFLNRRGFHTYVFCPACGHVFKCPACDLALTYHASQDVLKCHHCDFTSKKQKTCPACGSERIHSQGAGTERVEEEIKRLFPAAAIARIDSDTSSRRGTSEKTLAAFAKGEIDILVGTQIITKGHDFPGITLVGVIAADSSLNVPDFRAAERTFQILSQVAGRGGRGDQPGIVVVQTFTPYHHSIMRAQQHDYQGFYNNELPARRELNYPPYSRLIGLHFSSLNEEKGKRTIARIGTAARKLALSFAAGKADIIGPAESPLHRLRGRYRWQMLVRGKDGGVLRQLAQKLLDEVKGEGIEIRIDVDPVHFM